jgi:hypothetical protein
MLSISNLVTAITETFVVSYLRVAVWLFELCFHSAAEE